MAKEQRVRSILESATHRILDCALVLCARPKTVRPNPRADSHSCGQNWRLSLCFSHSAVCHADIRPLCERVVWCALAPPGTTRLWLCCVFCALTIARSLSHSRWAVAAFKQHATSRQCYRHSHQWDRGREPKPNRRADARTDRRASGAHRRDAALD